MFHRNKEDVFKYQTDVTETKASKSDRRITCEKSKDAFVIVKGNLLVMMDTR